MEGDANDRTTSYGVILFCTDPINQEAPVKYLCCQRRDTIPYVEFLRANIKVDELPYYFSLMTQTERERLLTHDFDDIWNDFMINMRGRAKYHEYRHSKTFFEELKKNGTLAHLVATTGSTLIEPPWGFAKGRKRSDREESLYCALREFIEETHFSLNRIEVLEWDPVVEEFTGSDGLPYRTVYFLAETNEEIPITYRILDDGIRPRTISEEIGDLAWMTLPEACQILNERRGAILTEIENRLRSGEPRFYRRKPFVHCRNRTRYHPDHALTLRSHRPAIARHQHGWGQALPTLPSALRRPVWAPPPAGE